MRKVFAIMTFLCALPLLASAQSGFPEKPLWLSNEKPIAGEEVSLYTVLYNGTDTAISGTLTFLADDVKLAPQNVSIPPQSSTVASVKWVAVAGAHTFSARFGDGTTSEIQQATAINISVAEQPPPTALEKNVDKVKEVAGSIASSSAPFVQKVAQAVFTQTEALRNAGIEYFEKKADTPASKKNSSENTSNAAGFTSTSSSEASGSTLHNIGQAALAATLFTLRSFYLFYPLLALIFFLLLYWGYKTVRRPHY